MTLEFWVYDDISCSQVGCELVQISADGQNGKLVWLKDRTSFAAFVPSRLENSGRGARVIGTCETQSACETALRVLGSLRASV